MDVNKTIFFVYLAVRPADDCKRSKRFFKMSLNAGSGVDSSDLDWR